ncbi:PDZ domain-containing protein [Nocardioides sp. JQ2195]|uniref:S1C family serine protease n=1 Tax=Nocardioides sp. JQ2195 TaxID=2592334 RepID=UPI00143E28FD|nr:trypsin-like peptidase domain-containing protein [Nocardioides sp. JQ2195]QIX25288.1 PDZ domain-containing protein [Nocardioides sp. JQ2195]
MSDENGAPEPNPKTNVRPAAQPSQQGSGQQGSGQQYAAPQGHAHQGPQFPPPAQGQPARGQHPPGQHAPGQPGPGQPAHGQPAYAPPPGPQWPTPAPYSDQPAHGGSDKRAARSSRSRLGGIGLLAGAVVLGAGAGFGGGWLQDETSGGGGGDATVDAGQIDIGGVNLQDLVSVQTVADKSLPSVVKIEAFGSSSGSTGSGIVISDDGMILTNYHVAFDGIDGELDVYFDDGTSTTAEVVGTDPDLDIAVIRADDVSGLTPMEFGAAENLHVGQAVVALGSPYGLESTVTAGIISTVNRPMQLPGMDASQEAMIYPALQTDAAINPGNSGGALVNIKGELVGMNSSNRMASDSSGGTGDLGSIGIGFAIPINVLEPIVEQLRNGEEPTHAWLGVIPGDARQSGVAQGARVDEFTSDSPAEQAGLEVGDVVVHIDDYPVAEGLGLVTTALNYRPGDQVSITVIRDGAEEKFDVTLGEKGQLLE